MTPLNPLFAIIIFAITFLTAYLVTLKYKLAPSSNRYETIDGLRGFLAISVFIHHASIWYDFVHINSWHVPETNLFAQLGQTGVSLFFMISSFLFVSKLLNLKGEKFNWTSFFISRVFRLIPIYFFSIIVLVIIVMQISNWTLVTDFYSFSKSILHWLGFTITDHPIINNVVVTSKINAGVVWSLPYEWLLYFSLPLLSILIIKGKPNLLYLLISLGFIYIFYKYHGFALQHILSFVGGMFAPVIIKYNKTKIDFNKPYFSLIAIASLVLILQYHSSSDLLCKLFITIFFTLIALGNTLFGLLKNKTLKHLGDISYSTYLLHGIVIFVTINYVYGFEETKALSPLEYCILFFAISPFVVLISHLSYVFVEKPFMKLSKNITQNRNLSLENKSHIVQKVIIK